MILSILLLVSLTLQLNEVNLRTGISQLNMGSLTLAQYTILFKSSLPDSVYNSLVAVSYVSNFAVSNGLNIQSNCPNTTQSSMKCTVASNNPNQNNIVYVSYVASDLGSLLVGSYKNTFTFAANNTSLSTTLNFKPQVDSQYINDGNSLYVGFYPFVSGISSLDPDFDLNIDSFHFDSLTLAVFIDLTIRELHVKDITITFGYLLYDASAVTVSLYEGQMLVPGSVAQGYIFGIKQINAQSHLASTQGNRRLQVMDRARIPSASAAARVGSSAPTISAIDASNVTPTIVNHNSQVKKSKNTLPFGASTVNAATASSAAQLLRSASSTKTAIIVKPITVNANLYSQVMQADGIIDPSPNAIASLSSIGVIPATNTTKSSYIVPPQAAAAASITSLKPAAAPASFAPVTPSAAQTSRVGVNPQLFNNLFSTNGFVIMTAADDIDLIYYNAVNPVQDPSMRSAAQPVYFQSIISKQAPVTCPGGSLVAKQQKIDYLQSKNVMTCIRCRPGTFFNRLRKDCYPFPVVRSYLNLYDMIV